MRSGSFLNFTAKESAKLRLISVLPMTVTLKVGNSVVYSPYRPADMGWISANDAPESISADLSAYIVRSDNSENNRNGRYQSNPKMTSSCGLQPLS